MKLSAPPPPPPPPSDGNPGASSPGTPDEQPNPTPATDASGTPATPDAVAPAAPKPSSKQAVWPAWYGGVDSAIVGLVIAFAFVAASFVARNSDVWVHLASGKRLIAGEYFPGGSDPFSYSAEGRTWVNHSWLTDAFAYLLYGGNGKVLVIAKALLVALTFGLLIAIRRPKFSLWPWGAIACVGVLACAPQFTLRPLVVSMLLLAVTLFLLFRMTHQKHTTFWPVERTGTRYALRAEWRFPLAIGVTFWIWANCDQWFFLGPLALALLILGDLIQKYGFNSPDEPEGNDSEPLGRLPDTATLAKALGVGLLACTLTPHHVRIWELPFELVGAPGIDADPWLRIWQLAPVDSEYINKAARGYNINGLAYAVLFVAGGLIVGLGVGRVRVAHIALWIGFAVLSLLSIYAVPFFAIVAVPLVAAQLNAYGARAQLKTWGDRNTRLLLVAASGGRLLSVLAVCALCVLAYPGWVHPESASPVYARRVSWAVEPDAALVRASEQLQTWRQSGALAPDARGVVTNTDLANYLAWYAPGEKVFTNGRYGHHRRELADHVTIRKGLGLIRVGEELPNLEDANGVLKRLGADYVAVHAGPGENSARTATRILFQHWGEWSVWYSDGRTTFFGWRPDSGSPKASFAALRMDPGVKAFGPGVTKAADPELKQPLAPIGWEGAFVLTPKAAPPGAAEALGWIEYKEALRARRQIRQGITGLLFFYGPPLQHTLHHVAVGLADTRGLLRFPPRHEDADSDDDAMRAIPLLAVRAARRAIAEDPDHPDAYFALGLALSDVDLPLSEGERGLGMVTAYKQCLARLPKPNVYKRGQFTVTGTSAALNLAQAYLGRRFTWRDARGKEVVDYSGYPVDTDPIQGMFGQPLFGERNGSVSRGRPNGPDAVPINNGTPFLLTIDLARETLQLAIEYAPLDLALEPDDNLKALVKQVEDRRRDVENVVIRYKERYEAGRGLSPKLPVLVQRAIQNCMLGEALELLSNKDTDLEKEYGKDVVVAAALRVGLELATGRLEDASDNLKILSAPDVAGALERSPVAGLVQQLKYQKAVLAGEYKTAGDLWESLAGRVGVFDGFPPPGPGVPQGYVLGAIAGTNRGKDPKKILPAMLTPPLVMTPGHAQVVQLHFWFVSWVSLSLVIQQGIGEQLNNEANFFYRRGVLFLLEGDIPAAKERFKETVRKSPTGWGLIEPGPPGAAMYLQLITRAEKKAARP